MGQLYCDDCGMPWQYDHNCPRQQPPRISPPPPPQVDPRERKLVEAVLDVNSTFWNAAQLRSSGDATHCRHNVFYQNTCRECGADYVRMVFQKDHSQ